MSTTLNYPFEAQKMLGDNGAQAAGAGEWFHVGELGSLSFHVVMPGAASIVTDAYICIEGSNGAGQGRANPVILCCRDGGEDGTDEFGFTGPVDSIRANVAALSTNGQGAQVYVSGNMRVGGQVGNKWVHRSVFKDIANNTLTELVPAIPGLHIHVVGVIMGNVADVCDAYFTSASTQISAKFGMLSNYSFAWPYINNDQASWFETEVGEALNVQPGNVTTAFGVQVVYYYRP